MPRVCIQSLVKEIKSSKLHGAAKKQSGGLGVVHTILLCAKAYVLMNVHTLIKQYFIAKNNSLLLKKDAERSGSGNLFFWWRVLSRC